MSDTPHKAKITSVDREILSTLPWSCTRFGKQSEIEAFIADTGKWETIADVYSVRGIDAEDIAEIVIHAVNDYAKVRRTIVELGATKTLLKTAIRPTQREIEILTLIAHGKTRGEISGVLTISEPTIKNYIEKSCQKLGAVNKAQAVAIAMTLRWIEPYRS